MKNLFFILFILIFNLTFGQQNLSIATEMIESLKKESNKKHGNSFNTYIITDINLDGVYEIIKRTNNVEQNFPGFLNLETYAAFVFDKIYMFEKGRYIENYTEFYSYLKERKNHYILWKKLIEKPLNLNSDSKKLILENKSFMLKEINRLIELTDKRII